MERIETVTLNAAQEDLWTKSKTALLWNCPAFSHLLYTMLDKRGSKHVAIFTTSIPQCKWGATDGESLILNPEGFFKLTLQERVFVCAHEILHCALGHVQLMHKLKTQGYVPYPDGTKLPYVDMVMQVSADLVINDILIEGKVGAFNNNWIHDKRIATASDSILDAYRKLFKQCSGKVGAGPGKDGIPAGELVDVHLPPGAADGKQPGAEGVERNEAKWKVEIAAAAQAAKLQGKLPAGLERVLKEALDPQVDWRDHLKGLVARRVGGGGYNWRKPDRHLIVRDIYAPARSGHGCGLVVVAGDTSGSIGDKELDMFFAEMAGILEDVKPQRLLVAWCDAELHRVDEAGDPGDLNMIRYKGAPGGGGTSFVPVFDWLAREMIEPDGLVYLTDGMGSFPKHAPNFPVIWGSISPNSKYPFGDVVQVPAQK